MKFGMFFVGEYLGVVLISAMITVLFLAAGSAPCCRLSFGSP
jgi:NADH-quinone oxidoreductase subunit H